MPEKKFRFKDLETNDSVDEVRTPVKKNNDRDELRELITAPKKRISEPHPVDNTNRIDAIRREVREVTDLTNDVKETVNEINKNMIGRDEYLSLLEAITSVSRRVDKINNETVVADEEVSRNNRSVEDVKDNIVHYRHGDEYIAFPDPDNDSIEYYLINGVVVLHNTNDDFFAIGDEEYTDITIDEVVDMLYHNPNIDVSISEDNLDYVNRFFFIYSTLICDMLGNLSGILKAYESNADYLHVVEDCLSSCSRYLDTDTESDDDDEDEEEEETDEDDQPFNVDEETTESTDEEDDSESEEAPDIIDPDDLPTIEEVEGDTPSNLRDYADAIDRKIPDELANEIIKNARSARRDRSIQLQYNPGK